MFNTRIILSWLSLLQSICPWGMIYPMLFCNKWTVSHSTYIFLNMNLYYVHMVGKQLQKLNKFLPSYIFICMCVYTHIYINMYTDTHNIPIHSEDHIYQRKYSFYITLYIYYIYNVIDHMYVHIYLCKNKRLKEWLQLFKEVIE